VFVHHRPPRRPARAQLLADRIQADQADLAFAEDRRALELRQGLLRIGADQSGDAADRGAASME
jgi:hypothetical protein